MFDDQKAVLISAFAKMTDVDREMLLGFAITCAEENPRKASGLFAVIAGGKSEGVFVSSKGHSKTHHLCLLSSIKHAENCNPLSNVTQVCQ